MAETILPTPVPITGGKPIIRDELRPLSSRLPEQFQHSTHLTYEKPPKTLSLSELGLPDDVGISSVGISEPFPLFSESAVRAMRNEIFTKEVWDNCMHSTEFAGCQLRGYCPKYAPFTYDAWTDPQTLSIISQIAGVDLIPAINIEIGNINISTTSFDDGEAKSVGSSDVPATKWHYDSYPFVCVVMLSDASKMIGGETAIKKPSGEIVKVRGPQMGCGIVLQGRCINHQALAARGGGERITSVTAFRPRDPLMMDSSVLTTIRPITDHSELYYQWSEYRVEVLQDRLRVMLKVLREQHKAGKKTDKARLKQFLKDQETWLAITNDEIV